MKKVNSILENLGTQLLRKKVMIDYKIKKYINRRYNKIVSVNDIKSSETEIISVEDSFDACAIIMTVNQMEKLTDIINENMRRK